MKNNRSSIYIVMGVSGSGKSTVGQAIANRLSFHFIDADNLHPRANILKMKSGQALNDDDRYPWLIRVNDAIFSLQNRRQSAIIVCSALKKSYRDMLKQDNKEIKFIFLKGSFEVLNKRLQKRVNHFMPSSLLVNQLETLEDPSSESGVITVDIADTFANVVQKSIQQIKSNSN